jgi:hypothetical protein
MNAAVFSSFEVQTLFTHAFDSILELSDKQRLPLLTVNEMYGALTTAPKCVSCGDGAFFLSLADGERCCGSCAETNHSLWTISINEATDVFLVPRSVLRLSRTFKMLPSRSHDFGARVELIGVRDATEVALSYWGSQGALDAAVTEGVRDSRNFSMFKWHVANGVTPVDLPFGVNLGFEFLVRGQRPPVTAGAEVSWVTTFVSLSYLAPDKTLETGRACLSCRLLFHAFQTSGEVSQVARRIIPEGASAAQFLATAYRALRTVAEAEEHKAIHRRAPENDG